MPVPILISDISTFAGSNSPADTETPGQGDDHFRAGYSFIAQLRDKLNGTADTGTVKNPILSGTATGSLAGASLTTPTLTNPVLSGTATGSLAGASLTTPTVTTPAFVGTPTGTVSAGSWIPTLTNLANAINLTALKGQWIRIGNVVNLSVSFQAQASSTGGTNTGVGISLPIASNFTLVADASGAGGVFNANDSIAVRANATTDVLDAWWQGNTGGILVRYITATYEVK